MNLRVTRITPTYPRGVFLQWEFTPDPTSVGTFVFDVLRSGSPEGEWTTAANNLPNAITFYDDLAAAEATSGVNLQSLVRAIYYKVRVTAPGGAVLESAVVDLDGSEVTNTKQEGPLSYSALGKRKVLLRRKIIRDETIQLQALNGVKVVVLKRKHFGERCRVCFDQLTKLTTASKCTTCFGTSWVGGYHPPILTWARFSANDPTTQLTAEGKTDIGGQQVTLLNYPQVVEGDLVVDPDSNARWKVTHVSPTSLRKVVVHQRVSAQELPRSGPEYRIPI